MELKEAIVMLLERHYPELPSAKRYNALAAELGFHEMDIRRLAVAGRNLEKQFLMWRKIAPLLKKHAIDIDRPEKKRSVAAGGR